jgi:polyferredoxin
VKALAWLVFWVVLVCTVLIVWAAYEALMRRWEMPRWVWWIAFIAVLYLFAETFDRILHHY